MSLSNNFPTIRPTLLLDFANSNRLDPRVTFTRASTATFFNELGVLTTANNDTPRFDHNPTTGAARGLLIEEQRTNLCLQSQDFATSWTAQRTTVSANSVVAPDGTTTADTITGNSATGGTQGVFQTVSASASTQYTISVFAKAGTSTWMTIQSFDGTTNPRAWFDLVNGVVGTVESGLSNAVITSVGNGWYCCSAVRTTGASATSVRPQFGQSTSNETEVTGDTLAFALWGAQLEAGAFATSYIPTTTTALTRNADVASMTGTNFSSWYNAAQGTVFCQYFPNAVGPATIQQTAFSISDGTIQNEMELFKRANADVSTRFRVWDSGNNQVDFNLGTFTATNNKSAVVYKTDDFAGILNNGSVLTDASGIVPSAVNRLNIGSDQGSVNQLNGCISRLAYYPTRLTNAQLQALTL